MCVLSWYLVISNHTHTQSYKAGCGGREQHSAGVQSQQQGAALSRTKR